MRQPAGACYAELGVLFIGVLAVFVLFIGALAVLCWCFSYLCLALCFLLMAYGALGGAR